MNDVPPRNNAKKPAVSRTSAASKSPPEPASAATPTTAEKASPQRVSDVAKTARVTSADITQAPEVRTVVPGAKNSVTINAAGEIEPANASNPFVSLVIDTGEIVVADIVGDGTVDALTADERAAYVAAFADSEESSAEKNRTAVSPSGPSRRDMLKGEPFAFPEPVTMLTADRVLEPTSKREPPSPGSGWNRFVYASTFHLVNLGDSPSERHRKAVDASISRRLGGGTRFIPVLTRKGGVGKTTVTTMVGMALARTREDPVIAIDANPDRGTLAERFAQRTDMTVRDLVTKANTVSSFSEFSSFVTRDKSRLDVLASDTDPFLSEAFDENDYNVVADLVSRYYAVALTDCGTGIVHSVMTATLKRADALIVVSGGSFDEARLAAETLTWLEGNGYEDLVRNSIVAINTATQGTNLVKIKEIEAHFQSRVRDIVRIPYDPMLATGSLVDFDQLMPATQDAARTLASLVMEGLPARWSR